MIKIKKVNPLSLAKILSIVYALGGLLLGAIGTIFSLLGVPNPAHLSAGIFLPNFGLASIIFIPIFFALQGFLLGFVFAFFYNLASGWIGGVEVEMDLYTASKKKFK